jgi:hypothetical protein
VAPLDRREWGRPCDRYILAIRRFLAAVSREALSASASARSGTDCETVSTADGTPDWSAFVPTALLLAPPRSPEASLSWDVDQRPARYLVGIKVADTVRDRGETRLQIVAARAFLISPARDAEVADRAAYLERSGFGARVYDGEPTSFRPVFDRLTTRERRCSGFLPPDENVALSAVLMAAGRPVVAYSPHTDWPRHPLVRDVAARLGCRILRRPLATVPFPVHRHVRFVRYRRCAAPAHVAGA